MLYNDHKSRRERRKLKGGLFSRYTDFVVINEDGKIEHNETLFHSRDIDLIFVPNMSGFSDDVFLVGTRKKKRYAFGTIQLK